MMVRPQVQVTMSISDMTNIPETTIIRKCQYLIEKDLIQTNEQRQYLLQVTMNFRKILPYQTRNFLGLKLNLY